MTREELKEHCEKQIEMCEMWAIAKGEEPSGKVYEEHKLILELLEQQSEDAISRQAVFDLIVANHTELNGVNVVMYSPLCKDIKQLSPVTPQPKYNANEWCHDCSEYDHNKHCCPRYNKVIRKAVEEIKQPREHWISYWDEEARCHVYKCSECGNKQPFDTKHCWECGARTIEPQESEETNDT